MKHLKQYSLFEAFESIILSKTLGFIKEKEEKARFKEALKRICESIEFPFSKLSDEFFEYLPFNKALFKPDQTGDTPCTATSRGEFPGYEVEGAKCEGGKLKRKWGSRVREVVCTRCNGTGVEPKQSDVKLLKFWFNKDGKFITTTAVDGVIRKSRKSITKSGVDYDVIKSLTHNEVTELKTGDVIKCNIEGEETICTIWKERDRTYAIQNKHNGSNPTGNDWKKYGEYSWVLVRNDYRDAFLLKEKPKKTEEEVDPYSWNVCISFRYNSLRVEPREDVQDKISDAHFAIIFDLGKLKTSEFKTTSDISSERETIKAGSKLDPSISDESIKKQNIERYMAKLSQGLDISTNISNCNRLVTRSTGFKNALFIIIGTDIISRLNDLIELYLKLLRAGEDQSSAESYVENLKNKVSRLINIGMDKSSEINDRSSELKKTLKSSGEDNLLQFFSELESFSNLIYQKVQSFQIDNLEDLEILLQKLSSIRALFRSDRYATKRLSDYFIDYFLRGYSSRYTDYFTDEYYTKVEDCRRDLKILTKIVEKI